MELERAKELVAGFRGKRLLVFGDVMLDRFIWGNVSRISPEAPVPVVQVGKESIYPGGAANVARNLVPFAGEVSISGLVGDDENGGVLSGVLEEGKIRTDGVIRSPGYATITKTRIIARQQQVVRIDHESPAELTEGQVEELAEFLSKRAGDLDGVILEDYGKGFLTQGTVDRLVPIAREAGLVITVDPSSGNFLEWEGVTAIKPNRLEAFQITGVPESPPTDDPMTDEALLEVGGELLDRWGTDMLKITLGEQGMMLFERDQPPFHIDTRAQAVFDVSGAGDTAIAIFTLALCAGASAQEAAELSNHASGVVVGKLGTATLTPEELLESVEVRD
ncbi:MAG: PfkB family carbohydrate kinase [Verrucomicrobiota bacterium]